MAFEILIVDDEDDIRKLIRGILEDEGFQVREAAGSKQAYKTIAESVPDLVVQDIWLQGSADDGLTVLTKVRAEHPELPFVMISGHGTIETAVAAIKDGAYDFIEKPFKSDRLIMMVRRALENAELRRENAALRKQRGHEHQEKLIGSGEALQSVQNIIARAAPTDSRILITGDAGTGKDLAARQIHSLSERKDAPFLVLNCATLRPDRIEAELFGVEAGIDGEKAITGVFEDAQGGTLLLDEIADMPIETQAKITRALQEERFHKIGGNKAISLDVRILATSHADLKQLIEDGKFREDLYYRLNVIELHMPSLSTCKSDIEDIALTFINSGEDSKSQTKVEFSEGALKVLKKYEWPGNVRQLKNVMEWIKILHGPAITENKNRIEITHLPPEISGQSLSADADQSTSVRELYMDMPLRDAREEFERGYLLSQVDRFEGNISKTAQFVGMERSALHRKLKSLQVKEEEQDVPSDQIAKKKASSA